MRVRAAGVSGRCWSPCPSRPGKLLEPVAHLVRGVRTALALVAGDERTRRDDADEASDAGDLPHAVRGSHVTQRIGQTVPMPITVPLPRRPRRETVLLDVAVEATVPGDLWLFRGFVAATG